jgi:dihydroorotate dehydrogenase electron transfer subunit
MSPLSTTPGRTDSSDRHHPRGQFIATVATNVPLCREHFRLVLRLSSYPQTQPGQFIQIACRDVDIDFGQEMELEWQPGEMLAEVVPELSNRVALLRRPFSLAGRRDTPQGVELDIVHRVVGVGTDWMARLAVGDEVSIIGPLGNRFELPLKDGLGILVGGGVGIPPMIYLAEALAGRKAVVFSGALTRDLLPLSVRGDAPVPGPESVDALMNIDEFARHGIPAVISTDDGSYGFRGFVTQALEKYLDRYVDAAAAKSTILYTCGPEPMMKRVADIAAQRGIECQIAVERAMACGMGTCQSCCIRVRKPDPGKPPLPGKDWCWRLACTDGPVFRGSELLW